MSWWELVLYRYDLLFYFPKYIISKKKVSKLVLRYLMTKKYMFTAENKMKINISKKKLSDIISLIRDHFYHSVYILSDFFYAYII